MPVIGGVDGSAEKVLSGCDSKLAPPLIVGGITLRPWSASAGDEGSGFLLEAVEDGKILWKTRHAKIVSMQPMKIGGPKPAEYLFTLERHFSPLDGEEGLRPCVYEVRREGLFRNGAGLRLPGPLSMRPPSRSDGILCALHRGDSFIVPQPDRMNSVLPPTVGKGLGSRGFRIRRSSGAAGILSVFRMRVQRGNFF